MPTPPTSGDDAELLRSVAHQPITKRLRVYLKLSGPGWLQSAITLGGASLSGSLYLGVLGGFGLLWLQPLAMVMGIVMLCAVGYVTLATGKRPLEAINDHVSPVLGFGWAAASLLASMVWAMPQYSLSIGVLQQNLLAGWFGAGGPLGAFGGKLAPTLAILALSTAITWSYGKPGRGVKVFEAVLKLMVGAIVLCFAGVALRLSFSPAGLEWAAVWRGFVPDFSLLARPADAFLPLIDATAPAHRAYWSELIVSRQRDVIVAAAASAVGINMTFLFPYSLLRRGWRREFAGLMGFDLATGMLIPFTLATSCVVIAAAAQFHAVPQDGIGPKTTTVTAVAGPAASPQQAREYRELLRGLEPVAPEGAVTAADERLAATLVTRDAFHLASALEPFTGPFIGRVVFGLGVLGMALSTITLLMVISGQVVCAIARREQTGWTFRLGSLLAASGALGPFVWSKAAFYLAIPASIFAFILLPIAYLAFFLLMNQRKLLGDAMLGRNHRLITNTAMGLSVLVAGGASVFMLYAKGGVWGLAVAGVFLAAAAMTHRFRRAGRADEAQGARVADARSKPR